MNTMNRGLLFAVALPGLVLGPGEGRAAPSRTEAADIAKDIVAMQIRKQGYDCNTALRAERDTDDNYVKGEWILNCDNATYRVRLIPRRAAHVERLK